MGVAVIQFWCVYIFVSDCIKSEDTKDETHFVMIMKQSNRHKDQCNQINPQEWQVLDLGLHGIKQLLTYYFYVNRLCLITSITSKRPSISTTSLSLSDLSR